MLHRTGRSLVSCVLLLALFAGVPGSTRTSAHGLSAQAPALAGGPTFYVPVEYQIPTPDSVPWSMVLGPDNNLWFAEVSGNKIGRITMNGVITEFPLPTVDSSPLSIVVGPDGGLWFTEQSSSKIGRISTGGSISEFPVPGLYANPSYIATGPDGNLWFTEIGAIGRITPEGTISVFALPYPPNSSRAVMGHITPGPDGALWFSHENWHAIGRISTTGVITEYDIPFNNPGSITTGPDGALWFMQFWASCPRGQIGRLTTEGQFTAFSAGDCASYAYGREITIGSDGALWYTHTTASNVGKLARITMDGEITEIDGLALESAWAITRAADGTLWVTLPQANKIVKLLQLEAVAVVYLPLVGR